MPQKLGQNFLTDHKIVDRIIDSADLSSDDFVLEIGPGRGILTEQLARKAKNVIAIEIDHVLTNFLKDNFKKLENLEIINADILDFDFSILAKSHKLTAKNYKIVANIPYYITAPIIRKFLESQTPPQEMILMVQKEVAERIIAKKGKMNLLALSVQYYSDPEILFPVSKKCFSPVPEVDSAVIKLLVKNKEREKEETGKIFRLARIGFSSKRKTLLNNLANGLLLGKDEILGKLKKAGFSENTRAQELSVEDWKKMAEIF